MDTIEDAQWYALRVQPQKEYVVGWMLNRSGAWAVVPTTTFFRRRTRYTKSKAEYARPEIPGCIFVRFPGAPAWYEVLRNHLILGAIGQDGRPWELDAGELHKFFATTTNGTMVMQDGERLVHFAGRLIRSTAQTRIISRKRKPDLVVEPTREESAALSRFVIPPRATLKWAA